MKSKLNKKILNWSTILTLLSAYILPGRSSGEYGYPLAFFKIPEKIFYPGDTIISLTSFDPFILILDILIIYSIINFFNRKFLSKKISS